MAFDWTTLFAGLKPEVKAIVDGPIVGFLKTYEDKIGSDLTKEIVEGVTAVAEKEIDALLS